MKENKSKYQNILQATEDIFIIWWNEVRRVFRDQGVLVFFILVRDPSSSDDLCSDTS